VPSGSFLHNDLFSILKVRHCIYRQAAQSAKFRHLLDLAFFGVSAFSRKGHNPHRRTSWKPGLRTSLQLFWVGNLGWKLVCLYVLRP